MRRGRLIITGAAAVCLLAGLVLWPTTALTQQSAPAGEAAGPPAEEHLHQPGHQGPPPGLSAELQETLQLYMIFRLTEELELSDEQALKIMPLVKEREQLRWDHHQQHQDLHRQLAELLENDDSSEAELSNAITAVRQAERDLRQREEQLDLEIAALLTTRQHAKFVLFQQQIHDEIRQRVHRLRGMQHRGRRQPPSR